MLVFSLGAYAIPKRGDRLIVEVELADASDGALLWSEQYQHPLTDLLAVLLRSQGFDVAATNSSSDGLSSIRENEPDLIVLDLMMPEIDGWEVCRSVRTFSQVPIIVLSALNDPSMVASVLDAGADDYISQPSAGLGVDDYILLDNMHNAIKKLHYHLGSSLREETNRSRRRPGPGRPGLGVRRPNGRRSASP